MDPSCSMRIPRRAQCVLPELTLASLSSSLAATPHKPDQLYAQQLPDSSNRSRKISRSTTALSKKSSSIAHIFFNRRPLDSIRRRRSSLLVTDVSLTTTEVVGTPLPAEEQNVRQSHRTNSDKNDRWRLQQLQQKDKKKEKHKQQHLHRRPQLAGDVGDMETELRKRQACKPHPKVALKNKRRPLPCPLTGKQFVMDAEKAAELTLLERVEIQQYDEISFVSTLAVKRGRRNGKIHNDMPLYRDEEVVIQHVEEPDEISAELCNDGYDDDNGDYLVLMGDHLAFRYEVLSALGQGSFGQVVYCLDHRTCKHVAVKIICNRRKDRDQALKEVRLLAQLYREAVACDEDPHIVHLEEHFWFRNHVCIAFEVLGTNLYDFLRMRHFRGVAMSSVRTVGKQLAQALKFLKQQQVIHCDLKPENVLLDVICGTGGVQDADSVANVTLIDFGNSYLVGSPMLTYIQSRFYRSPEVLLGHTYSGAIDMWSFACLLAELHTGHPIFAGENEREQFACILEVLGMPPSEMVYKCKRRLNFFDEVVNPADMEVVDCVPKPFVNSQGRRRVPGSRSLASIVMTNNSDF